MDLGQVFTRLPVARYMTSLFSINKESKILDPCFGEGAFLSALANDGWNHIDGYEIDSALYEKCKNKYQKYKLKNENKFKVSLCRYFENDFELNQDLKDILKGKDI